MLSKEPDGFDYDIIPAGTRTYQGLSEFPDVHDYEDPPLAYLAVLPDPFIIPSTPDYYGLLGVANRYLNFTQDSYLQVATVMKDMHLLRLDSVDNVNRLLKETWITDREIYNSLKSMFLTTRKDEKEFMQANIPEQKTKLSRTSGPENDYIFLKWLCEQGFEGYSAGEMSFHQELTICDPSSSLKLDMVFHITKIVHQTDMDRLDNFINYSS
jgi:hypothetical protein